MEEREERLEEAQEEQTPETEEAEACEEELLPEEAPAGEEAAEAPKGKEKGSRGSRAARKEAELKKELEQLKEEQAAAQAAERERYLRLAAEYDNFRKRSQKERESLYTDARADTVAELLPVYDNLERALKSDCSDPAFYRGVQLIMDQLMAIFDKMGVKVISPAGETFDPTMHNAVMHILDATYEENVVAEVFQKGFMLNGKVIRFAMVKVAN